MGKFKKLFMVIMKILKYLVFNKRYVKIFVKMYYKFY